MKNSVVPAAAATLAKQLVRNKKMVKRLPEQQTARDEQQASDKDDDATHATQVKNGDHRQASMSDTSLSAGFSFSGALSEAADSVSLAESSAQDEGGSVGDDGDGAGGTVLLVGAVGLVGLGVAVAAGGGGGNSNEAPDITSGSTASVAENAAVSTVVYTTVASDPDGDALSYTLSGTDAALFNISSAGVVTLKAPADFEAKNSYSFNVVASDGEATDTQAVTVSVTNVTGPGDAPVFSSGTTASIAENSAVSTVVYDANVSGTGATFALAGQGANAFTIDAATGEVRFKASPNFETQNAYTIDVIATQDGGSRTQTVAISVTDVPGPTITGVPTTLTFAENVDEATTTVLDANVEGTGPATFGLSGSDAAAFTIDATTGVVRFVDSPDFETKTSYTINVTATRGGETTTAPATVITITDIPNDGPSVITLALDDIPGMSPTASVTVDAGDGPTVFTDASSKTSNVIITDFTSDDVIRVSGILNPNVYNYTTGEGDDLRIEYQDPTTNAVTSIIIADVLVNDGPVFNYATAQAAVGFNFLTIA